MNSFFVLERYFVVILFFLIRINYQKTCGEELTMKKKTKENCPQNSFITIMFYPQVAWWQNLAFVIATNEKL